MGEFIMIDCVSSADTTKFCAVGLNAFSDHFAWLIDYHRLRLPRRPARAANCSPEGLGRTRNRLWKGSEAPTTGCAAPGAGRRRSNSIAHKCAHAHRRAHENGHKPSARRRRRRLAAGTWPSLGTQRVACPLPSASVRVEANQCVRAHRLINQSFVAGARRNRRGASAAQKA